MKHSKIEAIARELEAKNLTRFVPRVLLMDSYETLSDLVDRSRFYANHYLIENCLAGVALGSLVFEFEVYKEDVDKDGVIVPLYALERNFERVWLNDYNANYYVWFINNQFSAELVTKEKDVPLFSYKLNRSNLLDLCLTVHPVSSEVNDTLPF